MAFEELTGNARSRVAAPAPHKDIEVRSDAAGSEGSTELRLPTTSDVRALAMTYRALGAALEGRAKDETRPEFLPVAHRFRRAAAALEGALGRSGAPSAPPCPDCGLPSPAYRTVEGVAYRKCESGHLSKGMAKGRVA